MTNKIFIILILFFSHCLFSQVADFQWRLNTEFTYKPTKKLKLGLSNRFQFKDNGIDFQKSNFQLDISYKIYKKLEISALYRFSSSNTKDIHRCGLGLSYALEWDRLKLDIQSRYQINFSSLDPEFISLYEEPTDYFRQKFSLSYNVPKSKFELFFAPEIFIEITDKPNRSDRIRYTLGLNYNFKYGNQLELQCFYEDRLKTKSEDRIVMQLKYSLSIDEMIKKIRKDKKKKSA